MTNRVLYYAVVNSVSIKGLIGEYVPLRDDPWGGRGCCPFHDDGSYLLAVHAKGKSFLCHGCGASGDVVDFVAKYHRVTREEATRMLAERLESSS